MSRRRRERNGRTAALIALVAVVSLTPVGNRSSASQGLSITLDEAIEIGLSKSKQLAIARAAEGAAEARVGQARSVAFPQLSLSGSYTRLDEVPYMSGSNFGEMFDPLTEPFEYLVEQGYLDPSTLEGLEGGGADRIYMGDDDIYSIDLELRESISVGGAIRNSRKAAEHAALAEGWDRARCEDQTRCDIIQAYLSLVRARAALDVMDDSVEQAGSYLFDLESLFAEGMVLECDLMMARVRMSNVELDRNRSEHAVALTMARLCFQLGIDVDTEIEPLDPLERGSFPERTMERWMDVALGERPDLKAAHESVRGAERGVSAARADYYPYLTCLARYGWDRPNREYEAEFYDNWSVTVALQMNVFDWGGTRNRVKEAECRRIQAEKALEMVNDAARLEVKQSYLLRDETARAAVIAEESVRYARESLRTTTESFLNGMSTNTDVLAAQRALTTAEMNRIDAITGLRLAEARLELATGARGTDEQ